ncbi:MAG: pyridoxamine 5'-phosphate oxidase [Microthrixaceae bacterium]
MSWEGARFSYSYATLDDASVDGDALRQLRRWVDDAVEAEVVEPTAMTLATVDDAGRPHTRAVLVREIDSAGLVFYTNLRSPKSVQLERSPWCAAQMLWMESERQVRVEGHAHRVADREADAYFAGRPRGSQIGAWASPQSAVLTDRDELDALVAAAEKRFSEVDPIPRPPHWGGWRIVPAVVEFWQGRPDRLHDRLRYRRVTGGPVGSEPSEPWVIERLAP